MYDTIPSPDMIINDIIQAVIAKPPQPILITIGLHGQADGSAAYAGGSFTKQHFDTLFTLAANHPHVQLLIMSCRSAKKTDKLLGNIIMSSSEQPSYVAYTNYFIASFSS